MMIVSANQWEAVMFCLLVFFFFFQAEDGIRDLTVTGVQTCALPILIPAVVGGEAAAGSRDIADGGAVVGAAAFILAALGLEGDDGVAERTVGEREIGRASCRERV